MSIKRDTASFVAEVEVPGCNQAFKAAFHDPYLLYDKYMLILIATIWVFFRKTHKNYWLAISLHTPFNPFLPNLLHMQTGNPFLLQASPTFMIPQINIISLFPGQKPECFDPVEETLKPWLL